jgi:hypothetical protein
MQRLLPAAEGPDLRIYPNCSTALQMLPHVFRLIESNAAVIHVLRGLFRLLYLVLIRPIGNRWCAFHWFNRRFKFRHYDWNKDQCH